MSDYCWVEDGEIKHVGSLPKSWKQYSGFNLMDGKLAELKALGWLPMELVNPSYDNTTHQRVGNLYDIQEDKVVITDDIVAFTEDELAKNIIENARSAIIVLEQSQTSRLLREAHLGIVQNRPGHPNHNKNGTQILQELEDMIDVERGKL